jgi:peptide-methionine (S)-S-oxide reductase
MIHACRRSATAILIAAVAALLGACQAAQSAVPLPPPAQDVAASAKGPQTAVFAGGCFWGVEAVFRHVKGVKSAVSGYAGGTVKAPSYELVSTGTTGHAESVEVVFDPAQVTYGELLRVFLSVAHDPTARGRTTARSIARRSSRPATSRPGSHARTSRSSTRRRCSRARS